MDNSIKEEIENKDIEEIYKLLFEYGEAIEGNVCLPNSALEMISKGRYVKLFAEKIKRSFCNNIAKEEIEKFVHVINSLKHIRNDFTTFEKDSYPGMNRIIEDADKVLLQNPTLIPDWYKIYWVGYALLLVLCWAYKNHTGL